MVFGKSIMARDFILDSKGHFGSGMSRRFFMIDD